MSYEDVTTLPDPGPTASEPRCWLVIWDGDDPDRSICPHPFLLRKDAERFALDLNPDTRPNARVVPVGAAR